MKLAGTIHFDRYNPVSEKGTDVRQSLAHLDYSPLPRVTGRSFSMGVLVSMGGLMYVLLTPEPALDANACNQFRI
jgi:hypothetical protein